MIDWRFTWLLEKPVCKQLGERWLYLPPLQGVGNGDQCLTKEPERINQVSNPGPVGRNHFETCT